VIAVTCRNGEHFTLDPDAIERVEHDDDTVVVLEDGTKFVIGHTIDDLVRIVRDHRAAQVSARRRLAGPVPLPGFVPGRPHRGTRIPVPAGPVD
jgi:flagellar protein FlbD